MDKANNGMNEVLVNSECLESYLCDKYPNFKYIMSTTKCERNLDAINEACKKYHLVVPDYRDNIDDEFMQSLELKDKIEILINPYCNPCCQRRAEHYRGLSQQQLEFNNVPCMICSDEHNSFLEALNMYPTVLKTGDITRLIDMGFTNFKIEGRTNHNVDVIESYVYYMVKPEFKDEVRCKLIKKLWR
jgi:collagenase-like PrtC family protease